MLRSSQLFGRFNYDMKPQSAKALRFHFDLEPMTDAILMINQFLVGDKQCNFLPFSCHVDDNNW